ncbi:MAG TPA: molybdate ABC transporter substrate-binding protein [Terriglobia bacterium]|nr:molybdate ABC transporter substrate-binding protein [Terriglobia bacterium]
MKEARQAGITLLIVFLAIGLSSCSLRNNGGGQEKAIVVSAAVSVENAFVKIGKIYTDRTGAKVDFSFGASGNLEKQIEAGAPVDVFASAGEKEMDQLHARSLVEPGTRADFAGNALVLVAPAGSKLKLDSFDQLAGRQVKRIAMGNPQTVPAGFYARQALQDLHLWPKLEPRLIFSEDVRQALDYVMRGEVDAGIVYATDVAIAGGKVRQVAEAPAGTYGPIRYPIAAIKGCAHPEAAKQFIQLVLSPEGQSILARYGFRAVQTP